MHKFLKHILDPEIPLRDRQFQLLSTIALAEFVIVTLYNLLMGVGAGQIIVMLIGTAAFAGTVTFTYRTGKMRAGAAVSGLLYYLIYPLTFLSAGGMYGGAPAVTAFALVYVFLVTQSWERILVMAVCILASGSCYLISYFRPELLVRHTVAAENAESFLSILLVTLLL